MLWGCAIPTAEMCRIEPLQYQDMVILQRADSGKTPFPYPQKMFLEAHPKPEKLQKHPGNAFTANPGISLFGTAGNPQAREHEEISLPEHF